MKVRFAFVWVLVAVAFSLPAIVCAQSTTGTIAGVVRTATGAPLAGAQVVVSGPVRAQTTTDAQGGFTVAHLPAGLYTVDVNHGGYASASIANVAVFSGESVPLNVTMEQANLSSLKTIARVATSARSSINTGASAQTIQSAQDYQTLANPQINNVLQRIPEAVVEKGSSSPNTSISLGGAQSYETQVLLDGHPLSAGRYGVWFSQFFSSWLLSSVETESGPGNTTPFANTAIGGTANLVTPGFTGSATLSFVTGIDSFGSQYSNLLSTGTLGRKLQYVFGLGYGSSNGPFYQGRGCVVTPQNPSLDNLPGSTGIIQFCSDLSGSLFTKGELLKLRYNFSPVTSFEAGFVGSQAGYSPQGTAYGQTAANMFIAPCLKDSRGHTICSNPSFPSNQYVNGYIFYPGSNVYNNQPLFTGQFRTAFGQNTLLIRPYEGNIARIIDGSGEDNYPAMFYPLSQSDSVCEGPPYFGNPGPIVSGLKECTQGPFSVLEFDKLKGTTVSLLHPFGADLLEATYDYHSDETFAYYNTPSDVVVPDTIERFNTFSLTGDFALHSNLTLKAGLYDTSWKLHGVQSEIVPGPGGKNEVITVPLDRTVNRFDPHVALIYQPRAGLSYRLAYGTSETFPYASQVSGSSFITRGSATAPLGTYTLKNPFLNPEVATEFDLGADKRFANGSILSLDLVSNRIRDVFETLSVPSNSPDYSYINQPVNVANLSAQGVYLKYSDLPQRGLGYYLAAGLARSIVSGLPASFYANQPSPIQPANDQQQCSNGGSQVCIPYLKAYGSAQYIARDSTLYTIGADFEGKNNTYNQPPFAIWNFGLRHPVNSNLDVQLSVENLFNTNNFSNLAEPNLGVRQIGQSETGLGSIATARLPTPPRTLRLQLEYHAGRQ